MFVSLDMTSYLDPGVEAQLFCIKKDRQAKHHIMNIDYNAISYHITSYRVYVPRGSMPSSLSNP
jgi:hypothetical protein